MNASFNWVNLLVQFMCRKKTFTISKQCSIRIQEMKTFLLNMHSSRKHIPRLNGSFLGDVLLLPLSYTVNRTNLQDQMQKYQNHKNHADRGFVANAENKPSLCLCRIILVHLQNRLQYEIKSGLTFSFANKHRTA